MSIGLIIGAWLSAPLGYLITKQLTPQLGFAVGVTFTCAYMGFPQ